jgi:hypothetical protein
MRNSSLLMMADSGGLAGWVSYYVIVLVRVVTRKARARLEAWWRLYVVCEWSGRARGHLFCTLVLLTKNCAELEVEVLQTDSALRRA